MKNMEVAVFGGSFDPPTIAHEAIIEALLEDERYDEVWVMPSRMRADKTGISDEEFRMKILESVRVERFNSDPKLVISDFEYHLPTPTLTYMTHLALSEAFLANHFWYVFGSDSYATMDSWQHGHELKTLLPIVIIPRIGSDYPPVSEHLRHVHEVPLMMSGISSTLVRERLAAGEPVSDLVSPPVEKALVSAGL